MTTIEARALLSSKSNKLSGKAVELIRSNGAPEELRALIAQGAVGVYWKRDPGHPRSRLLPAYLLAVCFDDPSKAIEPEIEKREGFSTVTITLGDCGNMADPANLEKRLALFRVCIEHGFEGGNNNWRGDLKQYIIESCFYSRAAEQTAASMAFSKVLIEVTHMDITLWATNHYQWHGTPGKLARLIELGADPTAPGMLDNCVSYIGCSPSNGETYESRIEVIRILLMKGAKVKASTLQNSVFCDYSAHAHDRLKTFGLVDALIAAIDPSVDAESPLHTQEGLKLFRAAADAILEMRNEPKQNAERTRNLVQAMSKVDLHALQQLLSLRPAA